MDRRSPGAGLTAARTALRERLHAARAAGGRTEGDRVARALAWCGDAAVVACYASLPHEPGTAAIIEGLRARGATVLLPVLRREPDWAIWTGPGDVRPGWRGIPEPTSPRLGAAALGRAGRILVPGLAATLSGDRLGTGGGWYDRALRHASSGARVAVLLDDSEVLDALPVEWWDQPVDDILTQSRGIRCLPGRDRSVE